MKFVKIEDVEITYPPPGTKRPLPFVALPRCEFGVTQADGRPSACGLPATWKAQYLSGDLHLCDEHAQAVEFEEAAAGRPTVRAGWPAPATDGR